MSELGPSSDTQTPDPANRVAALVVRLLLPLLRPRARIAGGLTLLALLAPMVYGFLQLRDNNSVLGMLTYEDDDYRYFLNEYAPGFGNDTSVYVAFETLNALSTEATDMARSVQRTLEGINISFAMQPAPSRAHDGTITRLEGTAIWPWETSSPPPDLSTCLRSPRSYGVAYHHCLRRFLFPVEIEVESADGNKWYVTPSRFETARDQRNQVTSTPIDIICDDDRRRCHLRLFQNTFSHADLLPFLPGDSDKSRLSLLGLWVNLPLEPDHARLPLKNVLIGGEKADGTFTIVGITGGFNNLHDREDIGGVGLSWIRHHLAAPELDGVTYHVTGIAISQAEVANEVATTHVTLEPLAIVVVFLLMGFTIRRSLRLILIPICTVIATYLTTMGLYGLLGGSLNWTLLILPIIMVVTCTSDAIHLLGYYREKCLTCVTREVAFSRTVHALLTPCFYTSFTTAIGLFSIYCFAQSANFADFGSFGALGVLLAFVYSFIIFALLAPRVEKVRGQHPPTIAAPARGRTAYVAWLVRWCKPIVLLSLLLTAASLFAVKYIVRDFDFRNFFIEDTEFTRDLRFVEEQMSGGSFIPVIIHPVGGAAACVSIPADARATAVDVCLTDAQVDALWRIRDDLRPGGEWARKSIRGETRNSTENSVSVLDLTVAVRGQSAAEIMEELQCLLNGGTLPPSLGLRDEKCVTGPEDNGSRLRAKFIRNQARGLFNTAHTDLATRGRHTLFRFLSHQAGAGLHHEFMTEIQQDLDVRTCTPETGCSAKITGHGRVTSKFVGEFFTQMVRSFLLALLTVFALMFALLRRYPTLAFLSLLPNLVPFFLVFGFMAPLGIPLHYMTMMVAAMAMGLVVDDTIQFSYALQREFDDCRHHLPADEPQRVLVLSQAIAKAIETTGRAMIVTSMALMAGFGVLTLSDFTLTREIGMLLVCIIFIALLCDLLLFPALLLWMARSPRLLRRILKA